MLFPILLTVCGVLDSVPAEDSLVQALFKAGEKQPKLAFDALTRWANKTVIQVTEQVHLEYVKHTTGLAMMNPGYQQEGVIPTNPPILGSFSISIFFNFFFFNFQIFFFLFFP